MKVKTRTRKQMVTQSQHMQLLSPLLTQPPWPSPLAAQLVINIEKTFRGGNLVVANTEKPYKRCFLASFVWMFFDISIGNSAQFSFIVIGLVIQFQKLKKVRKPFEVRSSLIIQVNNISCNTSPNGICHSKTKKKIARQIYLFEPWWDATSYVGRCFHLKWFKIPRVPYNLMVKYCALSIPKENSLLINLAPYVMFSLARYLGKGMGGEVGGCVKGHCWRQY